MTPSRTPTSPAFAGLARLAVFSTLALIATGCADRSPTAPEAPVDPLFERYVALGNSITAGFQSSGINETTQRAAYPVLLAERMGTPFALPLLRDPGCPPPIVDALTGERLGGALVGDCAFRAIPIPPRVQNLAVPGATVADPLDNLGSNSAPNPLTQFILGGRTQIEAAERLRPTFASVWIGNNDVLGAALTGVVDPDSLTTPARFSDEYVEILDRLEAAGALGGVLIGVADVTVIPHLSPGAAYWLAGQSGALPPTFQVDPSCATAQAGGVGEEVLVPAGYAVEELLLPALEGQPRTLDCAGDARVLTASELGSLGARIGAFNQIIQDEAEARGWAYLDPNPRLRQLRAEGEIPAFPLLDRPDALFGPLFSLDGIHPADPLHTMLADELIEVIETTYGVELDSGGP